MSYTLVSDLVSQLVNDGLMVEPSILWESSSTVPQGYVISTDPAVLTGLTDWTPVLITGSWGVGVAPTPNAIMPNVVNLQQYQAYEAVNAVGLIINTFGYANSSTVDQGYVIAQNPIAGSSNPPGTVCSLTISLGPVVLPVYVTVP